MLQSCTCRNCGFVNLLPPDYEHQPQALLKAFQDSNNLVAQILRESRTILNPTEDVLISTDILELERLQSFYNAQLQEVQLHHRVVTEALEARRSIRAPIRRLPRDILIEIFHFARDSWWRGSRVRGRPTSLRVDGPLWVLGRVCGFWREILHTSPASWAQGIILIAPSSKHTLEILRTHLERTGEHPLSLQVLGNSDGEPAEEERKLMLFLIQESCHRWKNLVIATSAHHMRCLDSVSCLPALRTIQIIVSDDDYHSDICLMAPQLRQAFFARQGVSQMKLPPCITHYSGCITRADDLQFLGRLPKLRVCRLRRRSLHVALPSIQVPVVMPHIQHFLVEELDVLELVTMPRLESLVLPLPFIRDDAWACTTHFLQRSQCHLKSLSLDGEVVIESEHSIPKLIASDAFFTLSFLKVELQLSEDSAGHIARLLTPCSDAPVLLPNLYHLVLCMDLQMYSPKISEWLRILDMIRARRDAGLLKIVEVRFTVSYCSGLIDRMKADIRALTGDTLTMLVKEWIPPDEEQWSFWGSRQ